MPVRASLFETGAVPKFAYFLTSGVASVVADMQTGDAVEVGLYGCEAMPGSIHLLGDQRSATRCFMQVDGTARRINSGTFSNCFGNVQTCTHVFCKPYSMRHLPSHRFRPAIDSMKWKSVSPGGS